MLFNKIAILGIGLIGSSLARNIIEKKHLQRAFENLIALERNIRWDEGDKLYNLFSRTQKIRKDVIKAKEHQP